MGKLDKHIIQELKSDILLRGYRAARLATRELIVLYFQMGKKISFNTKKMVWGSKVLEQVSQELQYEQPGIKGFSATNLQRMTSFYEYWASYFSIYPTLSDQFANNFLSVSFSHHYLIATKSNSLEKAQLYIQKTFQEFWSYRTLQHHIKADLFTQKGSLPNNFKQTLPTRNNNKALQMFKDEYLPDFINIEDPYGEDERLIENQIVRNIKKFILTIGNDFAFIGNQYRLIIEQQEYFIDLLFYNRKLQCLLAFELKNRKVQTRIYGEDKP